MKCNMLALSGPELSFEADPQPLSVLLQEIVVIDTGSVAEKTLGSSPSGNADANTQFFW